ncbi:MAG: uracil-DNA glycosylase [Anaerolineae bacterium]|nr:uracil-DNA glycosylase [Anaerolineae bacterium]
MNPSTLEHQLTAFVERLSRAETAPDAYNQYAYGNVYNDIRRANLLRYLNQIAALTPQTILVMEAPGYRGSRLTGVPVGSRSIVLKGIPELGLLGKERGYQDVPEPGFEGINGEQTATAVWSTLAELKRVVLIWGSYPFHPCEMGKPLTNRAPRRTETEQGIGFLRELLDLFTLAQVIAVGNVADDTLKRMGIDHQKIRHPSHGGKTDFVNGLRAALTNERG